MSIRFTSQGLLAAACVTAFLIFKCLPTGAEEFSTSKSTAVQCVVLRVSDKALNSLLGNHEVDRQIDVSDNILGTAVSGKLRLVGKPSVTFVESPQRGVLNLRFDGTTYSRTTGYNGPAILYNRAVTTFSATRQIVLEPAAGMYGLPPQVAAQTQVFLEGIDATRGGLIGWMVRRRATRVEASRHDEATEIVRQKAARRIEDGFMRHTEQRLAQLNSLKNHPSIASASAAGKKSDAPQLSFSTTAHCLQITATFGPGKTPHDLPPVGAGKLAAAPVELWIHKSLASDPMLPAPGPVDSKVVEAWFETLAQSVPLLSKMDSKKITALLAGQQIQVRQVNDWKVVALEKPTNRSKPIAPPTSVVVRRPVLPSVSTSPPARPSATDTEKRSQAGPRIWTSGAFTAHAEFLELLDDKIVRLRRVNGVVTRIPLDKLSAIDQQWIAKYAGTR